MEFMDEQMCNISQFRKMNKYMLNAPKNMAADLFYM